MGLPKRREQKNPDYKQSIQTLKVEECLRELHVVSPGGEVFVGVDAVILLARLFPQTRLIGTIAGAPGIRVISRMLY